MEFIIKRYKQKGCVYCLISMRRGGCKERKRQLNLSRSYEKTIPVLVIRGSTLESAVAGSNHLADVELLEVKNRAAHLSVSPLCIPGNTWCTSFNRNAFLSSYVTWIKARSGFPTQIPSVAFFSSSFSVKYQKL